jgi:hypothetical protein
MTTTEIITEPRRTRWRWFPLASGVALWIVTFLTSGARLCSPRRARPDRRRRPAHRLAERRCVLVRGRSHRLDGDLFLITVGIFLHDALVAS